MNKRFWFGIFLFALSYLQFLLPSTYANFFTITAFWSAFMIGIILICDGTTLKIAGESLIGTIRRSRKDTVIFISISTLGGILLDLIIQWLGKLWVYPYFSNSIYTLVFIGGFSLYWLMILESYYAVKYILDKLSKGRKVVTKPFKYERLLFEILNVLGIILISFSFFFLIKDYDKYGGYYFNISDVLAYKVNFIYILMAFFGGWFVCEYIQFERKINSFLKNLLHGYFNPVIAILIASFILAVIMESQNLPHNYWGYVNWPFEDITFLGLPVSMFLTWPLHYIGFLSLFRAFTGRTSKDVWRGDTIE